MSRGLFIIVSAPSGAGKSSLCQRLRQVYPEIKFSVSYTSRPPRPNEVNGKDYYFISRKEFQKRIDQGEFIEWVENYGHLYGSSKKVMEEFVRDGKDLLLDIEPRGAKKVKQEFKGGVYVFILPPSRSELLKRLEKRGHETDDVIQKRFKQAESELKEISWYDYVIFNKDLETAVNQLISIYVAEKCKRRRLQNEIKKFKE
ncbi:MAG: guanylate kinase [Deltaproteobacteria bacterium HGW-Deltaproteobacteria-13]|jgi:guanylate kinase|nr:MAG: guanylate kinase [Deltaproteobacteria bacterium HGW-Deltaproteobacteria-13]